MSLEGSVALDWSFILCWRAPAFLTAINCDLDSRWITPCCTVGRVGQLGWSAGKGPQQLAQLGSSASSGVEGWCSSVWSFWLQIRHLGLDAGPGIMIVPAPCALFYAGSGGFVFDLYILAKKIDPFGDSSGLVLRDSHNKSAG